MFKRSLLLCFLFAAACSPSTTQMAITQYNEAARSAGLPIVIDRIGVSQPNSAGGVDFRFAVTNTSDKTIKYLEITGVAYNAVGDTVRGEIRRTSTRRVTSTGPYGPSMSTGGRILENAWYNNTVSCAIVTKVEITYMDNTTLTFSSLSSIQPLLRPGVTNSCRV
jgi:hypothetical protein